MLILLKGRYNFKMFQSACDAAVCLFMRDRDNDNDFRKLISVIYFVRIFR